MSKVCMNMESDDPNCFGCLKNKSCFVPVEEKEETKSEEISYLECRALIDKAEKISEQYAKKQKEKKDAERKHKQLKMMNFIKEEYENLNEDDLVYCLRKMSEY